MALICAFGVVAASANAANLYRFTNAEGKVEISSSIPNDRVIHGYDVIDMRGRVIQRVAPQLTPEQQEAKRIRMAARRQCEADQARVSALYQYESDIDNHKAKALEALAIAIENDQANLVHARGQHAQLLDQAARMERSGNSLTSMIIANIERAKAQVTVLEDSIANRNTEREDIERRFEQERQTFLKGGCAEFDELAEHTGR